MNKKIQISFLVLVIILTSFWLFRPKQNKVQNLTKIRIGWQTPWATQGQLTQILKNTNLLKENNLEAEFKGFNAGGPLNEAALGQQVDVIFTADQPAATLLSKNTNWVIIGRLMYNRVSLYVPPKSPIIKVSDLKGKTVAMPFGAAAQRMALKAEKDSGLDPKKDVNNINLDIYEQADLVKNSNMTKWDKIDALAGFDPTPAIFEEKGLIRNLAVGKVVSVILMSKDFIKENPNAPIEFLKSFYGSYDFYKKNIEQSNQWFVSESKLDITDKALQIASDIEPNLKVENEIRLDFTEDDLTILQDAANFIFDQSLVKVKVNMKDFIDLFYLKQIKN